MAEKYSIITGASDGLGKAFACSLARRGSNLILISRNRDKLEELQMNLTHKYGISILVLDMDLREESTIKEIEIFLLQNDLIPEMLINNAGIGKYGKFSEDNKESYSDIINLNIRTVVDLSMMIIKLMEKKPGGVILNVSSTFSFRPSPFWSVYGASKSFIYSFSKSIGLEYRDSGIRVAVLCPGKIQTAFDINSGKTDKPKRRGQEPTMVAETTINELKKGKSIILPGFKNKLKYRIYKFIPETLFSRIFRV